MIEDKFEHKVKNLLHNYAPEVPSEVYGAMRKRLWWSHFTKLSFTRFNMWYLLLLLTAGTSAVWVSKQKQNPTPEVAAEETTIPAFKSFEQICIKSDADPASAEQANTKAQTERSEPQQQIMSDRQSLKTMTTGSDVRRSGSRVEPTAEQIAEAQAENAYVVESAEPGKKEQPQHPTLHSTSEVETTEPKSARTLELTIPVGQKQQAGKKK